MLPKCPVNEPSVTVSCLDFGSRRASFAGTRGNNFECAVAAAAPLTGGEGAAWRQGLVRTRSELSAVAKEFDGPIDAVLILVHFHFHLRSNILFAELELVGGLGRASTPLDDIGRFCVHLSAQMDHDRNEKES